jgi:NTP pyrophosphatase (non-canonical NTP hydrolase)
MDKPFNGLSPAEAERLYLLLEECGEVVQIVGKILRHGYESCHPDDKTGTTNRTLLEKELGDVAAAVTMMTDVSDVDWANVQLAAKSKLERVKKYLHHQ